MSDDERRFDILIVPARPRFRASKQGIQALLRWLVVAQIFEVREQVVNDDETAVEVLLDPGQYAHHAFAEGDAPPGGALIEAVLRHGEVPTALGYGEPGRQAFVYLELVGARYYAPSSDFLDRLHQILYLRPEFFIRPHAPIARTTPGEPEGARRVRDVGRRAAVTIVDKEDV